MHIAVIVPVRNVRLDYLRRCVRSIGQARAKSREVTTTIVLSDDCSKGNLASEYGRLALAHDAEYVRSGRWRGIGGARNLGAAHVGSATHAMFVDADDEIDEDSISSMAISESDQTIVTGLCHITGRGRPHTRRKAEMLRLVEVHHGLRTSPLLYTNVLGQPTLLPIAAFAAVDGYLERRYSGEHVDLWGRLLLSGKVQKIVLVPKILYYYHSTVEGNYRRDEIRHRSGIADALRQLASGYFNDARDYRWVAFGDQSLPSLYAPTGKSGELQLPPWAEYRGYRWWLDSVTAEQCEATQSPTVVRFNLYPQSEADLRW